MRVDIEKYAAVNKDFIQKKYKQRPDVDLGKMVSEMACSTMVPCIVVAYWLGEVSNWHPDIIKSIESLIKFYGYTEITGKPEGAPL